MATTDLRIAAIYTYPIKSIRGCTPNTLTATALGFSYDRRFMLMRASDGTNMHVSRFPEMCLFTTELSSSSPSSAPPADPDTVLVRYGKVHVFDQPEEAIEMKTLSIPLSPDVQTLKLDEVQVNMHGSATTSYDMGAEYNEWFSRRLGYQVLLLYIADKRRKVLGNVTPNHPVHQGGSNPSGSSSGSWFSGVRTLANTVVSGITSSAVTDEADNDRVYTGIDDGLGFADCAPFLIVSTKSWENVSRRLPDDEEMDMTKFRPNIVVDGALEDFEEDYWAELHFSHSRTLDGGDGKEDGVRVVLTANCARCNSLNVDYGTGKVGDGEAGKILKKLQKDRRVDLGAKYSPVFGRYGFLAQKSQSPNVEVTISVGDVVQVVKRNEARTRFQWPSLSTDK